MKTLILIVVCLLSVNAYTQEEVLEEVVSYYHIYLEGLDSTKIILNPLPLSLKEAAKKYLFYEKHCPSLSIEEINGGWYLYYYRKERPSIVGYKNFLNETL